MLPKALETVSRRDLEALLGNVREGKTIEFKREMPAHNDAEKVKFLKAVSSLANTAGGDLLIGVTAKGDLAESLSGLPAEDSDTYRLRLEQLIASSLEPRLPRCEFQPVDCGNGRYVLVVRTPKS